MCGLHDRLCRRWGLVGWPTPQLYKPGFDDLAVVVVFGGMANKRPCAKLPMVTPKLGKFAFHAAAGSDSWLGAGAAWQACVIRATILAW